MSVYLITYDLQDSQYEDAVLEYIKKGSYVYLVDSSYAVNWSKAAAQISEDIQRIANNKIHVYVLSISRPYSGYGPKAANDWLAQNLP